MVLLYTLFAKFVPIISIWELKAGLSSRMDLAVLAEERLQSTRLDDPLPDGLGPEGARK